jgi:nitrate reductase gamma subunit
MNKKYMVSFVAVFGLFLIAWGGVSIGLQWVFGVIIPYLAVQSLPPASFAGSGMVAFGRTVAILRRQAKSFPWIRHAKFDSPSSRFEVWVRMALEILTFRSLFRNTRMKLSGGKLSYQLEIFLWVGALAFHYAFLTVILRHTRFFTEPVPWCVQLLENVDSFFHLEIIYPQFQFGCRPCTSPDRPAGCRRP